MNIVDYNKLEADFKKVGIKSEWYFLKKSDNTICIFKKTVDKFFENFRSIGIVANITIEQDDLNQIGGSVRWILLGIAVGFDYFNKCYTYKVVDGVQKKRDKPVIGNTSETLRNLIRSEIKKALKSRGIQLNEYLNQIITSQADIILSRNDDDTISFGIKKKDEMGQVKQINLTKEELSKLIETLKTYM